MANKAIQNGSGRGLRLDPYQAQHSLEVGDTSYKLDSNGAVVRKQLSCGLPVTMAVPTRAFKGVAAFATEDAFGDMVVTLQLLHHDPELSVPLLVSDNMDDIAADWHSWSRLMKLPMLLLDDKNVASNVRNELGAIMVEAPWERRKRITTVRHRPNFLRRRKTGQLGEVVKISAAELIARR